MYSQLSNTHKNKKTSYRTNMQLQQQCQTHEWSYYSSLCKICGNEFRREMIEHGLLLSNSNTDGVYDLFGTSIHSKLCRRTRNQIIEDLADEEYASHSPIIDLWWTMKPNERDKRL
jgi:hypothetical protein